MTEKIEVTMKWTYEPHRDNYPNGMPFDAILAVDIEELKRHFYEDYFLELIPEEVEITGKIVKFD